MTAIAQSKAVLAANSKSFALAARLLPPGVAEDAAVFYAFCRRADDLIDRTAPEKRAPALAQLRAEVDALYGDVLQANPLLAALRDVVHRHGVPRAYLDELLDGMEMDVRGVSYTTLQELLAYCHRVAGTVGLVMCHIMGVRDRRALRHAAHLGIAMQLTNICRDVAEDWQNGRLYLPRDWLGRRTPVATGEFPEQLRDLAGRCVRVLLAEADRYYESADAGIDLLEWRCALAVRTARHVYSAIGRRIEEQDCDVLAPRAVVPRWRKLLLAAKSIAQGLAGLRLRPAPQAAPLAVLRFPDDVLPL